MNSRSIGQILLEENLITKEQLNAGLKQQEKDDKMIGTILIEMGYIEKELLIECLNKQIREMSNMVYTLIQKEVIEDTNSLIDFEYYDQNKNELIFLTKKSWNRVKLSTQIAIIDIQHIWLIMLSHYASMLFKTFDKVAKEKEINNVLDLLISYAIEHFSVEESLLDIIKYDSSHYDQHKEFIRYFQIRINRVRNEIVENNKNPNVVLNDICEYLNNWILSHIAIYDTNYAIKISQLKNKEDIFMTWTNKLKTNKLALISKRQKELYDMVIKKE
jgi:hemerythrin-like metal-binding protein